MLGKLARWLRIIGHDTIYNPSLEDEALISLAKHERRILITRDSALFKKAIKEGASSLLIKSSKLSEELVEISPLLKGAFIGTRCTLCNTLLVKIERSAVSDEKVPKISPLSFCPGCGKIYWHGGHWEGINKTLSSLHHG
jgi:uncharacterized protein with PIN domain